MPAQVTAPAPSNSQTTPAPDVASDLYGASSEIEGLDTGTTQPDKPEPNEPAKPVKVEKPSDQPANKPKSDDEELEALDAEDRVVRPGEKKDEDPDPEPEKDPEKEPEKPDTEQLPTRAKDLKVVYERVKAEKKDLEAKLTEAQGRIKQLETSNPDEVKALTEKLSKSEARRNELESEMRFVDYRKSAEFRDKYEKPIHEAWQRAIMDLDETVVTLEDGSSRKANVDDLVRLSNLPLQQASAAAREMFGDAAQDILAHRRTIRELTMQQSKAIEGALKEAEERLKTREVEGRANAEKYQGIWRQENETLATKFPKWVKPVDGDEEGNKLLNAGYETVDRFFNDSSLKPEERLKAHASIRMKAANHDRMALRLRRMAENLNSLKKKLAEYESSAPPGGKTTPRTSSRRTGGMEDDYAEIEALNVPGLE